MWEPRGLPLGEIGAGQLVHARPRYSPLEGGDSLGGPLILGMPETLVATSKSTLLFISNFISC